MTSPNRPPLSPAAQAVVDAAEDDCIHPVDRYRIAAAALRAAVEQVDHCRDAADQADRLLDIAAELEGHHG